VYRFLPWCHPEYDITESRAWLARIEPDWEAERAYNFAIISSQTGQFLGGVGLNRIDEHPVANLGYWIRSSATAQGIATEATVGLARYAFAHLAMMRVEIVMSIENTPSRRVAEKAGAVYEGILRNRLLLHGRGHDAHSYSLLRSDVL
jgi:ribosomal-protein-serine acetyltransferase